MRKACLNCRKLFMPRRKNEVYCSAECGNTHRLAQEARLGPPRPDTSDGVDRIPTSGQSLDRLATAEHMAQYFHITLAELEHLAENDEIPARRIGDRWLFSVTAVNRWMAGRLGELGHAERLDAIEAQLAAMLAQVTKLSEGVASGREQ